jgi:hypothetical protein
MMFVCSKKNNGLIYRESGLFWSDIISDFGLLWTTSVAHVLLFFDSEIILWKHCNKKRQQKRDWQQTKFDQNLSETCVSLLLL